MAPLGSGLYHHSQEGRRRRRRRRTSCQSAVHAHFIHHANACSLRGARAHCASAWLRSSGGKCGSVVQWFSGSYLLSPDAAGMEPRQGFGGFLLLRDVDSRARRRAGGAQAAGGGCCSSPAHRLDASEASINRRTGAGGEARNEGKGRTGSHLELPFPSICECRSAHEHKAHWRGLMLCLWTSFMFNEVSKPLYGITTRGSTTVNALV